MHTIASASKMSPTIALVLSLFSQAISKTSKSSRERPQRY
jgi:hypothetical protein